MKIKTIIITFSCLFVFLFSSCQEPVNQYQYNTYNSVDSYLTLDELRNAVKEHLSSLNFDYDVNTDSLFSECGKYKIILDINSITIDDIKDKKIDVNYNIVYCIGGEVLDSGIATYDFSVVNGASLLLSFDDQYITNWKKHLSLFIDNGLKVTFFVYGSPSGIKSFAKTVQDVKLEVGYHTLTHKKNLEDFCDADNLNTEAIEPVTELHKNYIYANSFALPNGGWIPYVIEELLKYYKIVRFYGSYFTLYKPEEIGKIRVIHSCAIDNNRFNDDDAFEELLFKRLLITRVTESVFPCTSHNIVDSFDELTDSRYAITTGRLQFIIDCLNKMNMKSSLYKDYYYYIYKN